MEVSVRSVAFMQLHEVGTMYRLASTISSYALDDNRYNVVDHNFAVVAKFDISGSTHQEKPTLLVADAYLGTIVGNQQQRYLGKLAFDTRSRYEA